MNFIFKYKTEKSGRSRLLIHQGDIACALTLNEYKTFTELQKCGLIDELQATYHIPVIELSPSPDEKYAKLVIMKNLRAFPENNNIAPQVRADMALKLLDISAKLNGKGFCLPFASTDFFAMTNSGKPVFINFPGILKNDAFIFHFQDFFENFWSHLEICHKRPRLVIFSLKNTNIDGMDYQALIHPIIYQLGLNLVSMCPKRYKKELASFFKNLPYIWLMRWKINLKFLRKYAGHYEDKDNALLRNSGILKKLASRIKKLDHGEIKGKWTNYYKDVKFNELIKSENSLDPYKDDARALNIAELLKTERIDSSTLLDLGANKGYFSIMAYKLGYKTLAADYDAGSIGNLFSMLKADLFKKEICPMVCDIKDLSQENRTHLKSDITIALGLIHHLFLVERFSWSAISELLSDLTEKTLIVEFKENTRARGSKVIWDEQLINDYKVENFIAALKKYFTSVENKGYAAPDSPRVVIVCKH